MLINEGLPMFLVEQARRYDLANKKVAILGMAFKAESDDKRDSLSYKLKKLLEVEALEVLCTDPYIHDEGFVTAETGHSPSRHRYRRCPARAVSRPGHSRRQIHCRPMEFPARPRARIHYCLRGQNRKPS